MRWTVQENDPPIQGAGAVMCDGEKIPYVLAFDTKEGWIAAYCASTHEGTVPITDRGIGDKHFKRGWRFKGRPPYSKNTPLLDADGNEHPPGTDPMCYARYEGDVYYVDEDGVRHD